ncbi:NAD-dependent epimerase/dehydratase [Moorella glycerini]|uniref:UDP-glucose 4-epimerase n=1 Tax=Neomoorella stamsii TaxID=1266720 RepID=A0A9X7P6K2_9FIRM|nr:MULTISPECIES: SDR family oxidoreductase [Moorella]PRR73802.1 UDP-glucose 4-epimerase [Moorella stamsii]CEP67180.1 NAD-dependent epimerase/dehydratase [Moorella glycerini]
MPKYLVTGGAGFIGSHLVHALVKRGETVRVIDNFSTGKKENLADIQENVEIYDGDLRDIEYVREAMVGVDYVFHEAALPSVPRSIADPVSSNTVNVQGTLNILIAARDAGVKKVVYAASSSAYGNTEVLPKREDMKPMPLSPYAVSKLTGEYYCRVFYEVYGLQTVSLRYFNVFGPRQDPASQYAAVVPKFITSMLKGEQPVIFGDGEQSRDFTYIDNVINANLAALQAPELKGEVLNIACGQRYTLNELVTELNNILGTSIKPVYEASRKGDVKHSLADISLAKMVIGYKPCIDFREGLRRTVEWYKKQMEI